MTRRTRRIVVKCHPEELKTIQAKATSLDQEAATYLRELGMAEAEPTHSEERVQRQLYWLAGTMHELLSCWLEHPIDPHPALQESMQMTVRALRQLQLAAELDKLPPHQLNMNFAEAIRQVHHAYQNHQE